MYLAEPLRNGENLTGEANQLEKKSLFSEREPRFLGGGVGLWGWGGGGGVVGGGGVGVGGWWWLATSTRHKNSFNFVEKGNRKRKKIAGQDNKTN